MRVVNECVRYLSIRERTMTLLPIPERSAAPDGKSQTTGPAISGIKATGGSHHVTPDDATRAARVRHNAGTFLFLRNHHVFTGPILAICAQTRRLHRPYAHGYTLEPCLRRHPSGKLEVTRIEAGTSISKLNGTIRETDQAHRIFLAVDVTDL